MDQRNLALGRWAFLKIEQQNYIHGGGRQKRMYGRWQKVDVILLKRGVTSLFCPSNKNLFMGKLLPNSKKCVGIN